MPESNTAFTGSIPELYDRHLGPVLFEPYARDLANRLHLQDGVRLLELACGTGRVAIPLAEAGFEVTGLDRSAAMLEVARSRAAEADAVANGRLTLVEGDMSEFELGGTFGLIVIAFRSFQMLLTPEAERSCLQSARRQLRPGGLIAINLFDPRLDGMVPGTIARDEPLIGRTVVHPESGNVVQVEVLERTNHTVDQLLEETWRFTEFSAPGVVLRQEEEVLRMRWLYRYEMRYLLELSGFEVVAEYSDFYGSPPDYGKEQVWVARAI